MHNALRLARGPRGIKDEQRVFGPNLDIGAIGIGGGHLGLHIDVAALGPGGLIAGVLDDKAFHPVIAMQKCRIRIGLQRRLAPATRCEIRGNHNPRVAVIDPVGQRIRREACENDGMNGPDPRAGQHRIGGLRDHRQIDHHAVALLDALRLQNIGHAAGVFQQFGIGDMLGRGLWVIRLPDNRGLGRAGRHVAVDAIGADVQLSVLKPFDRDLTKGEIRVLYLGERARPIDAQPLLGPEGFGISDRRRIHLCVLRSIDMGIGDKFIRSRIDGSGRNGLRHENSSIWRAVSRPAFDHRGQALP